MNGYGEDASDGKYLGELADCQDKLIVQNSLTGFHIDRPSRENAVEKGDFLFLLVLLDQIGV
jgi:hypothetical protein